MGYEKLAREVYEIRGFDFTFCCAINSMYNLELGESLAQRLEGLIDFRAGIEKFQKKVGFRKWRGKIKGVDGAYIGISEVRNYLTRVSLVYRESDREKINDIRAVLKGVQTRNIGKKTLLDYAVEMIKKEKPEKKHEEESEKKDKKLEDLKPLPQCGIYSSD